MSKVQLAILLFSFYGSVIGQNRRFLSKLDSSEVPFYSVNIDPTTAEIDVINFDDEFYSGLMINKVNGDRLKKGKYSFIQDSLLNLIALTGINTFSKSRFTKKQAWNKEQKSINVALIKKKARHKAFVAFAFMIDLVDLNKRAQYFYDGKNKTSSHGLYLGKCPNFYDKQKDDYVEPEAVNMLTEVSFCDQITKLLNRNGAGTIVFSKKYSQIGAAIRMDKRTLNRNKRPSAYVMMIFSGKRMQKVKILPEYLSLEAE